MTNKTIRTEKMLDTLFTEADQRIANAESKLLFKHNTMNRLPGEDSQQIFFLRFAIMSIAVVASLAVIDLSGIDLLELTGRATEQLAQTMLRYPETVAGTALAGVALLFRNELIGG